MRSLTDPYCVPFYGHCLWNEGQVKQYNTIPYFRVPYLPCNYILLNLSRFVLQTMSNLWPIDFWAQRRPNGGPVNLFHVYRLTSAVFHIKRCKRNMCDIISELLAMASHIWLSLASVWYRQQNVRRLPTVVGQTGPATAGIERLSRKSQKLVTLRCDNTGVILQSLHVAFGGQVAHVLYTDLTWFKCQEMLYITWYK